MHKRHGDFRLKQQEFAKGKITGYKLHGINKKIANLSYAQMKTMRPQWAHLPEMQLRQKIAEDLSQK